MFSPMLVDPEFTGYNFKVIAVVVVCIGIVAGGLMFSKREDKTVEAIANEVASKSGAGVKAKAKKK